MNFSVIRAADTLFGKEIALALTHHHRNLILLGREPEKLEALKKDISRTHANSILCFALDESSTEEIIKICDHINDHFHVDMLVNYTNTGGEMSLQEYDVYSLDRKLKLDYVATPIFIHQLLPNLSLHAQACIMNLIGYSNAGVTLQKLIRQVNENMSRCLENDLRKTGITVLSADIAMPAFRKDLEMAHGLFADEGPGDLSDIICTYQKN